MDSSSAFDRRHDSPLPIQPEGGLGGSIPRDPPNRDDRMRGIETVLTRFAGACGALFFATIDTVCAFFLRPSPTTVRFRAAEADCHKR